MAQGLRCTEVDGLVLGAVPHENAGVTLRGPLDENFDGRAEVPLVGLVSQFRDDLGKSVEAPLDDLARGRVDDLGRRGSRALGVDEGEGGRESDLPHEREGLLEVLGRLAGEADDDVGRKRDARHGRTQPVDEVEVSLAGIAAMHGLEDARRAALHGEVQVRHDPRGLCHGGYDLIGEVLGVG